MSRPQTLWSKIAHVYQKEIWNPALATDRSPKGLFYTALRVVSITVNGFISNRVTNRAAALTFSSLLGLGPLIAIGVLIGGFVLGNNSDQVAKKLAALIENVAPQLRQLNNTNSATSPATTDSGVVTLINDMIEGAHGMINGANSGMAATLGIFSLIFIVLLLFKSIEDAFNDIWGIRIGRSLLMRVVFYWTILTLGAVLFCAAVGLLGAGAAVNVFSSLTEHLPYGAEIRAMIQWMLPLSSGVLIVAILTLVYRVIPNTKVRWGAALTAALVVTALLLLNNFVALFYVRRVILTKSLYGSLALPIVLMLGLYIFWLYLLIGSVISYAVQNVHFRNSQAAWSLLTESMRERLSLVVLLTISRRFRDCLPPASASQISELLKVPTQIVNESLNRLVEIQLITTLRPSADASATEYRFQVARPLNKISLYEFKTLDDNTGDDPIGQSLEKVDPLLCHYDHALKKISEQEFFKKSLEQLLDEYPFDVSRPPFAFGDARQKKS